MRRTSQIAVLLLLSSGVCGFAQLQVPRVFGDHMVLQQGEKVPVWGTAAPKTKVTVTCRGQAKSATANDAGKWRVVLDAMKASAEPAELAISAPDAKGGTETRKFTDVLVGEVWFCGGQSNMEFTVDRAQNAEAEMAAAKHPLIRMFVGRKTMTPAPAAEIDGSWLVCAPDTVKQFSAVGYFFGRELQQALQVPVGLVHVSAGWTPAEAWMSREALLADPELRYIAERWDAITTTYPAMKRAHEARLLAWQEDARKAKAEGKPAPGQPKGPPDPNFLHRASGFYNGSIAPLTPLAIRGVIWYQGETNEVRGWQYRHLFPALIADWRRAWGRPQLPFLFVQVASVLPPDPVPTESEWAELRESQLLTWQTVPHTGMAVTIDIGEEKDVHPKNKQDVGKRLALQARAGVYGEKVEASGPVYKGMKIEGGKIRLTFAHAAGLGAKGGQPLAGFAIAGADRLFAPAQASVEGDTVVVWSEQVKAPVAVRYAWANNPAGCNLYNQAGLPASPMRTDDWPGKTTGFTTMTVDLM